MIDKLKKIFYKSSNEKRCVIHKTKKYYKIISMSETCTGLYIADGEVFILPISDIENLKLKLFQALDNSRKNIPHPIEWGIWQKEHLKSLKEKSFSSLYKNSTHCQITLKDNIIKISPLKASVEGLEEVENNIIIMSYSPINENNIIEKIIGILNTSH